MRLRNAFKLSVFEVSKLVSTKTLLLKHYYRCQGLLSFRRPLLRLELKQQRGGRQEDEEGGEVVLQHPPVPRAKLWRRTKCTFEKCTTRKDSVTWSLLLPVRLFLRGASLSPSLPSFPPPAQFLCRWSLPMCPRDAVE